ncbi:CHASE2 domain-containing protein [Salinispirillum marinum]|uniref:CHASE2 domain-containing protein n=2 Tax=Saccharospirillaceae TaxID=255527 RepID=A0ABV8B9F9_9GAMM
MFKNSAMWSLVQRTGLTRGVGHAVVGVWRFVSSRWVPLLTTLLAVVVAVEELRRDEAKYQNVIFDRLDYVYYDTRLALLPKTPITKDFSVVVLDIDERSLAAEGRWPWSRAKLVDLNRQLMDAGVYTITYDVLFSEPERNLALEMSDLLQSEEPTIATRLRDFEQQVDFDVLFAESIAEANAVLGYVLYPNEEIQVGALPAPVETLDPDLNLLRRNYIGYVGNLGLFQEAASSAGLINPIPDLDGVIRRVPLLEYYNGSLYPSLGLASLYNYFLIDVADAPFGLRATGENEAVFSWVEIPAEEQAHQVLTSKDGSVYVPYAGAKKTFPYISATDVLRGTLTEQERLQLDGAIVLIGTSALGLLDLRSTPLDSTYPGVEVHANVINGLLSDQLRRDLDGGHAMVAITMLILGALYVLVFRRFGPFSLLGVTVLLMVVVVAGNVYLWQVQLVNVPVSSLLLLILLLGVFNMLEGFLRERSSRQEVRSMFGQYVPSEYIDIMLNDPDSINFEGANKELTVLFSDIRSFTTISEQLTATQLKGLLNRYFTPITGIIFNRKGTIDKYVGDMVMAFWGAPLEDPQHAEHALEAAIDMINKTAELRDEFVAEGLPAVEIGIGLNTGSMNVGDMGSEYRRSYTVLGDAVNLGSRLESLTKFYGVKILVGPETYTQCPNYFFRFIDRIMVKGKEEPIECYEPLCRQGEQSPELQAEIDAYNAAYALYRQQQWQEASDAFAALLMTSTPQRAKLYTVYLGRIADLRTQTLSANWDGAYRHTSK